MCLSRTPDNGVQSQPATLLLMGFMCFNGVERLGVHANLECTSRSASTGALRLWEGSECS